MSFCQTQENCGNDLSFTNYLALFFGHVWNAAATEKLLNVRRMVGGAERPIGKSVGIVLLQRHVQMKPHTAFDFGGP